MKRTIKSFLWILVVFSLLSCMAVFAASPDVNVWESSCRLVIKGNAGEENAGGRATAMLIKKSANPENVTIADIGFVDQIKIEADGSYKFATGYDGEISDYKLCMYLAGENITDTLESAVTTDKMITTTVDVTYGRLSADISVEFMNELLAEQTYTIIAVYYDENGKMLSSAATKTANVSQESIRQVINTKTSYVEGARTLKVIVWDSLERFIPLAKSAEGEISDIDINGDGKINAVFIGDSIYEGAGATKAETSWVFKVGEWMKENYSDETTEVNYYNKGVSGTSTHYSFMRLERDVLSYNPDVVFVGSSTNDGAGDTRREIESIVRTLLSQENPPYIIITHLARYDKNSYFATFGERGKAVADHYGIPFYDATNDVKAAIENAKATTDEYYSDNVHPADKGYAVIADSIIKGIGNRSLLKKATLPDEKLLENSVILSSSGRFSSADTDTVTRNGNWTQGSGSKGAYLQTGTVGDSLKLKFTGNAFAFEYGIHKNSGRIEVYVDGELIKTANPRYNDKVTSYQMICQGDSMFLDLAENKEHNVELKVIESDSNVAERDITARIYSILTATVIR